METHAVSSPHARTKRRMRRRHGRISTACSPQSVGAEPKKNASTLTAPGCKGAENRCGRSISHAWRTLRQQPTDRLESTNLLDDFEPTGADAAQSVEARDRFVVRVRT